MQNPPQEILDQWALTPIAKTAETAAARVWKVRNAQGGHAALKIYRRADRGNEASGSLVLRAWRDRGAVEILNESNAAILMEWLDGPSLGDIARQGEVTLALTNLAQTAARLHAPPRPAVSGLKRLSDVFAPLKRCTFSPDCPTGLAGNMNRAMELAQQLIETQQIHVPLHGDLHPDNIILTDAGARVIDAKGYLGDPGFELANVLRHPKGMPELVRQRDHLERSLTTYADALGIHRERLACWAAAKCALSIFHRANGPILQDSEADLLHMLLEAADQ